MYITSTVSCDNLEVSHWDLQRVISISARIIPLSDVRAFMKLACTPLHHEKDARNG